MINLSPVLHYASCVTATLLLTGCVTSGVEVTDIPLRMDYVCAQNKTLPVMRSPDQRVAAVMINGQEIVMYRVETAVQEKYSDGNFSLYLDGERAMFEQTGIVIMGPCVSPVSLPTYYR
jgi:membrane-bound inhibitor of C-type lysozyme